MGEEESEEGEIVSLTRSNNEISITMLISKSKVSQANIRQQLAKQNKDIRASQIKFIEACASVQCKLRNWKQVTHINWEQRQWQEQQFVLSFDEALANRKEQHKHHVIVSSTNCNVITKLLHKNGILRQEIFELARQMLSANNLSQVGHTKEEFPDGPCEKAMSRRMSLSCNRINPSPQILRGPSSAKKK